MFGIGNSFPNSKIKSTGVIVMILTGNTIFITGGGTGIGRGLAEALHKLGNKVIISGRRRATLEAVTAANSGIEAVELDIANSESIKKVAAKLIADHPSLNTLINNAGVMLQDDVSTTVDENVLETEIATNLTGTIRLTSALIDHLKKQKRATVVYNSSTLAFTPLAMFAVYSATKAALHSYAMSQRFMLRDTSVAVKEIAPPWVGTGLVGAADDPRAVPLDRFVSDTLNVLATDANEILVEEAKIYRNHSGPGEYAFIHELNRKMSEVFA
jgi:uncharacterized oxidoreductase